MTTPLQRIANRNNAQKSTGPRTAEGKHRSRSNALTHGLTASAVVLDDEEGSDFEVFHETLMDELLPNGVMEAELAERVISLTWRSRRFAGFEAAILEWMGHWSAEYYDVAGMDKDLNGKSERMQRIHKGLKPGSHNLAPDKRRRLALGRLLHEEMNHNLLAKFSRYETHVLNQLSRAYKEFLAERARRAGTPAEALQRLNAMMELDAKERGAQPDTRVNVDRPYGSPEMNLPRAEPRVWSMD